MTVPPLTLIEVSVGSGARFAAGSPRVVVKGPNGYLVPKTGRPYDVSPDGRRFLMMESPQTSQARAPVQPPLIVVLNWFEELKGLVPTN
jgi:hypothetical protein